MKHFINQLGVVPSLGIKHWPCETKSKSSQTGKIFQPFPQFPSTIFDQVFNGFLKLQDWTDSVWRELVLRRCVRGCYEETRIFYRVDWASPSVSSPHYQNYSLLSRELIILQCVGYLSFNNSSGIIWPIIQIIFTLNRCLRYFILFNSFLAIFSLPISSKLFSYSLLVTVFCLNIYVWLCNAQLSTDQRSTYRLLYVSSVSPPPSCSSPINSPDRFVSPAWITSHESGSFCPAILELHHSKMAAWEYIYKLPSHPPRVRLVISLLRQQL